MTRTGVNNECMSHTLASSQGGLTSEELARDVREVFRCA
jgi:hypothetical protein